MPLLHAAGAVQNLRARCFGVQIGGLSLEFAALLDLVEPPLFLAYPLQLLHQFAPACNS